MNGKFPCFDDLVMIEGNSGVNEKLIDKSLWRSKHKSIDATTNELQSKSDDDLSIMSNGQISIDGNSQNSSENESDQCVVDELNKGGSKQILECQANALIEGINTNHNNSNGYQTNANLNISNLIINDDQYFEPMPMIHTLSITPSSAQSTDEDIGYHNDDGVDSIQRNTNKRSTSIPITLNVQHEDSCDYELSDAPSITSNIPSQPDIDNDNGILDALSDHNDDEKEEEETPNGDQYQQQESQNDVLCTENEDDCEQEEDEKSIQLENTQNSQRKQKKKTPTSYPHEYKQPIKLHNGKDYGYENIFNDKYPEDYNRVEVPRKVKMYLQAKLIWEEATTKQDLLRDSKYDNHSKHTTAISAFEVIKNREHDPDFDITKNRDKYPLTVETIPMNHNIWKCYDEGFADNSWVYNYLVWIKVGRLPLAVTLPDIRPAKPGMLTLFYQQGSTDIDGLLINQDNDNTDNDNTDNDNTDNDNDNTQNHRSYKAIFGGGLNNMRITAGNLSYIAKENKFYEQREKIYSQDQRKKQKKYTKNRQRSSQKRNKLRRVKNRIINRTNSSDSSMDEETENLPLLRNANTMRRK